jgi:hypothetical protein
MPGLSDQLHTQDVPDHVSNLISPDSEEQENDIRYVETHDDSTSTGDYHITVWNLTVF